MPGHFMWSGTSEPPNRGGLAVCRVHRVAREQAGLGNSIPSALLSLGSSGQHGVLLCCLKRPLDPGVAASANRCLFAGHSSTAHAGAPIAGESMAGRDVGLTGGKALP